MRWVQVPHFTTLKELYLFRTIDSLDLILNNYYIFNPKELDLILKNFSAFFNNP